MEGMMSSTDTSPTDSAQSNTTTHTSPPFDTLRTLIADRHTCRQFSTREVPRAAIEQLLELAQRSASWCNTQPWEIDVTSGAATEHLREELIDYVANEPAESDFDWPTTYPGILGDRRRTCGYQLYASVGIERDDQQARTTQMLRNFRLFEAPHLALVTTEAELGTWGALDCGLWLQAFLLGAHALGVAAAPQAALASYAPFFRRHFGLPESRKVVFGVSFGYADEAAAVNSFRTERAGLTEVVRFHR